MIGEIADPRRFEACAYINSGGEKLEVLIALDNELWAIPSRSKEALIARIRLQFWHDEIEKIKNKEAVTTPLSNLIAANFGHEINMLEIILELIEAHIDDLEFFPKRQNEINIWEKYYKAGPADDLEEGTGCADGADARGHHAPRPVHPVHVP